VNSRKGEGLRKVWAERKGTPAAPVADPDNPNDF
jgi:hypothetical protein